MRSLVTLFVAVLLVGCEPDRRAETFAPDSDSGTEETGIRTPLALRSLDPARLSLTVDVNGTTFRVDRPNEAGRWVIRPIVDPGRSVNLSIEWRSTVGGSGGPSLLLASLGVRRPPVSAGDSIDVGREEYDTGHDEDGDGATNLEEVVFGSDPFLAADAPPADFAVESSATDAEQDSNLPQEDTMTEVSPPDPDRGPADVPGSAFYRVANNSARLSGPVVGDGSVPTSSLARAIPFRVDSPEEGLSVLHASVMPNGGGNVSIVMTVANNSTALKCAVQVEGLDIRTDDAERNVASFTGAVLYGVEGRRIDGGALGPESRCIGPGSVVYAVTTVLAPLEPNTAPVGPVARLTIGSVTSAREAAEVDTVALEPVSYRVGQDAMFVTLANRGDANLQVYYNNAFLLDEEGIPVGFLFSRTGTGELTPGEEMEARFDVSGDPEDFNFFQGNVSTVRVVSGIGRVVR